MKLKIKNKPRIKETITVTELKQTLFRFLKEFNLFPAYIKQIKTLLQNINDEILVRGLNNFYTYDEFLLNAVGPIKGNIFPNYTKEWEEIRYLWYEWAYENYKYGIITITVK